MKQRHENDLIDFLFSLASIQAECAQVEAHLFKNTKLRTEIKRREREAWQNANNN